VVFSCQLGLNHDTNETEKGDTSFVCNNQMLIQEEGAQGPWLILPQTNIPQEDFASTTVEAEVHILEHDVRTCS